MARPADDNPPPTDPTHPPGHADAPSPSGDADRSTPRAGDAADRPAPRAAPAGPPPAADDLETAEAARIADDAEHGPRHPRGLAGWTVALLAAAWSLFQLALAGPLTLSSDYVRCIHLTFAIALVFLCFPALRKITPPRRLAFLAARDRLPIFDVVLALLAAAATAYYAINYDAIAQRQGMPSTLDVVAGVALVIVVLEAARRAMGPALPVVAGAFIAYGLLAERMPRLLAFKSVSPSRMVDQLALGTEGIFGVPLQVSASTVFLFVLLGAMLEKTGGGRYFVQLAFSLLGRFRGGPAKAAVLASGMTGMVSGSSIANTVTTGTFTIPLMKRCGYPAHKAAAVEVAASTNGQLMPPIMGAAAFIIAEYCNMPYLQVVRAAAVPAIVSYLALIYITHLEACKLGLEGLSGPDLPRFFATAVGGIHFLVPLGALVTMLMRGFSPQVSALTAICALAGLVVVVELARALRARRNARLALADALRTLAESLVAGGRGMMAVAVACGAAGIIVGVVGLGLSQKITSIVDQLAGGSVVAILLLTALASLILGMGLPTTATYIVMASLTTRVIVTLGDQAGLEIPLIAAHLFCFFFGILADDTPPVGLAAYAAASIAKSNPIRTGIQGFAYDLRTAILPFIFVFNTDLLLWNVHGPAHIVLIFVAATAALMAFAALTQRYMVTRLRLPEAALLAGATVTLLRPQWLGETLAGPRVAGWLDGVPDLAEALRAEWLTSKPLFYGVGLALFAAAYAIQRRRRPTPRSA